jgi:hypothetical protein
LRLGSEWLVHARQAWLVDEDARDLDALLHADILPGMHIFENGFAMTTIMVVALA